MRDHGTALSLNFVIRVATSKKQVFFKVLNDWLAVRLDFYAPHKREVGGLKGLCIVPVQVSPHPQVFGTAGV